MEYVLNDYHRNVSDQELLDDLKSVANRLNAKSLSQNEYLQHGKYGLTTFRRHFGGWNKALTLCGIAPNVFQLAAEKSSHNYQSVSSTDLLSDVSAVALRLRKESISCGEYTKNGKFSKDICFKRFGTWENTLLKAGLKPYKQVSNKRIPDESLLEEIERIWIQLGRQPTSTDIKNGVSIYCLNAYTRHFGGWRAALDAFINWVNSDNGTNRNIAPAKTCLETNRVYSDQDRKTSHFTARDINLRLRFKVMSRDKFKCCLCGASPAKDSSVELQIDHIIPWSKGGETVMDNLQTLCTKCNLGKSNLLE